MEENLTNANHSETVKIKTHHARIVVDGTADKPYYSIEWFDAAKQEYYVGYSSYVIDNVLGWLKEYFEIVEAPKTNADRIRAMSDEELAEFLECFGLCHHCTEHHRLGDVRFSQDEKCDEQCEQHCLEWLKHPAE